MKITSLVFFVAVTRCAADDKLCTAFNTPATDMVMDLSDMSVLHFAGVMPVVVNRVVGDPSIRVLRHTSIDAPIMKVGNSINLITLPSCSETGSPSVAPDASSASSRYGATLSSVALMAGAYLSGASLTASAGIGTFAQMVSVVPPVTAQGGDGCLDVIEIEIHGPEMSTTAVDMLQAENAALAARVAELELMLADTVSMKEAEQMQIEVMVENFGRNEYAILPTDITVEVLDNDERGLRYNRAGFPIYNSHNPEPAFHLANAGDDSLVRDMQGEVFQFPTESNEPQEVAFALPDPPAYSGPTDLIYMPIKQIASLLRNGDVDCVTIVQTFIDRLTEFDPYLAIVTNPLYDRALETAASHQALLDGGTDVGPLMCIPFGVKDHHQIYDDEPTTLGHILYRRNVHTTKSTLMQKLLDAGAIPIAKMVLGTYASGSGWSHGMCMSPYLNGNGGGSSCGSGSGAAIGALPFAISEETSGSIASPSFANLMSGHISSYGAFSRAGAALLCSETDHLGFHSRYLSDYGVIFNYARTGVDPLDGDTVAIPFVNPDDVNVTELRVMLIDGEAGWVYDSETDSYSWEGDIPQSRSKSGWQWGIRSQRIKDSLDAAGVPYDTFTLDEAGALWSFDEDTPYWNCASPDIRAMMGGGPWAKSQDFYFGLINSKRHPDFVRNLSAKDYRYMQYCMVQMGKVFLNDNVWATYDVIIDTHTSSGGGYPIPGSSFEQWVRTAKTFVIDYMEELPCLHQSGAAIEAAVTVLTAKPFEDYKNFAIGQIIQDPANLLFPNDEAIKTTFADRTRCALEFFEKFNNISISCPPLNTDGAPPYPNPGGPDRACDPGNTNEHLPDVWKAEPYLAPYLMDDEMPDRAIWRYETYGPVACTMICPFIQSFCDYKGIVCDEARLQEENSLIESLKNMTVGGRRRLNSHHAGASDHWDSHDEDLDET